MSRINHLRETLKEKDIDAMLIVKPVNRAYISGFTGSNAYLIISQNSAKLLTDFRYVEQAKQQCPDFEVVRYHNNLMEKMQVILEDEGINSLGFEKDYVTYDMYEELATDLQVTIKPLSGVVEDIRILKDSQEVKLMQKAQDIAEEAFSNILGFIKPGVTEKEIALELEFTMRKLGASGLSFPTIAASGIRSALPHGRASDKVMETGDFLTLDFGAVYDGYCGDMTRTIVIGTANDKQQEVYNIVLKAHLAALEAAKPGIKGKELDAVARDIITAAGYGDYFGHGLGHGVGREVHEAPRASQRSDTELIPGHVVTIEPGIYLPNWGGVRIEDMIMITEDGYHNFNSSNKDLLVV